MGEFSISHLLIVGVILLIFFGPSRLPGLGQSLGKAIRGFKEGINDVNSTPTETSALRAEELKPAPAPASAMHTNVTDVENHEEIKPSTRS
jgi:sec-independent protein translocase protein TatA